MCPGIVGYTLQSWLCPGIVGCTQFRASCALEEFAVCDRPGKFFQWFHNTLVSRLVGEDTTGESLPTAEVQKVRPHGHMWPGRYKNIVVWQAGTAKIHA